MKFISREKNHPDSYVGSFLYNDGVRAALYVYYKTDKKYLYLFMNGNRADTEMLRTSDTISFLVARGPLFSGGV